MDAVRFLQERKRMCAERPCVACPVYATGQGCTEDDPPELAVATVEEWSAAHPHKTRQDVFLKQWPEANVDKSTGVLIICPAALKKECRDDRGACNAYSIESGVCNDCRRKFWMQEV